MFDSYKKLAAAAGNIDRMSGCIYPYQGADTFCSSELKGIVAVSFRNAMTTHRQVCELFDYVDLTWWSVTHASECSVLQLNSRQEFLLPEVLDYLPEVTYYVWHQFPEDASIDKAMRTEAALCLLDNRDWRCSRLTWSYKETLCTQQ